MQGTLRQKVQRNILLVALFFTAFSSLAYELVWTRELSYIFGSTAIAASSVLAVFMAGLALGSLYAGRILESRSQPFRFLAQLQFAMGIACILTLFAFKGVDGLQSHLLSLVSEEATFGIKITLFLLTSCVLIVPTFLIGIAFPCIVQLYHAKRELIGQSVSRCYWIDTLGASIGMLLATFAVAPTIGFFLTSLLASGLNIFAGILIFLFFYSTVISFEKSAAEPSSQMQEQKKQLNIKVISFLFFLSGFAALVLEVLWIRHWGLIYGSGLHGFAIVVVTFLFGLSLGSLLYDRFLKKIKNQILLFSAIELSIAATAIIITAMFPYMESVFLKTYYAADNYYSFLIIMSLICFSLLLFPTILMGMTLPTLCAVVVSDRHIGQDLGRLYAINSLGALAGSFCAGFAIIPALGIYHSSFLAGGIYIFIAFAFLYCFSESRLVLHRAIAIFISILILTAAVFNVIHVPNHLYNGVFYTGTMYTEENSDRFWERQRIAMRYLRFLKNGEYGQVAVTGLPNDMLLRTNGRIDSGTTNDLVAYQSMLGHIPMIIHEKPSHVLNIGLGCGWTVRAAAIYPVLESIDSVEINPIILEVNRNIFHSYNNDIVNHPKVNNIINDGRNYVAHTNKTYDVVISEPTGITSSGTSALLSKEFYVSVKSILNENGMLCQWFPRYEVTERYYKILLNTIKHIFPYIYEFDMSVIAPDDYYKSFLIVACKKPIDINKRIEQQRVQYDDESDQFQSYIKSLIDLTQKSFNRDNEALEEYIGNVKELNTDDLPILEFHALKNRFRKFRKD